jgi:serine/threonine protein kinase
MFLNEAALAGKLNHPHITQIFDAVVEGEYSYIVMEYVEGGTLEKFCTAESLLEPQEVAEISFKCVRALAFAQTLGSRTATSSPATSSTRRAPRSRSRTSAPRSTASPTAP